MDDIDRMIAQLYGFAGLQLGEFAAGDHESPTERLMDYWAEGEGGQTKIRWHEPCPFCRCLEHAGKYFPKDPKGLCNHLEQRALGHAPNAGPFHSNKKHCPC